ncbi:hypothetical protein CHUAL_004036 [Chamberlinius hualienensis]
MENGHPDISEAISEPSVDVDPYENKYYTLLKRCESIQQSNERLVHRLCRIKDILRRLRHERRFLMRRLDEHEDNYRGISLTFQLGLDDDTPSGSSNVDAHLALPTSQGLNSQFSEQDNIRSSDIYQCNSGQAQSLSQSMPSTSTTNIPSTTNTGSVASTSKRKRNEKSSSKSSSYKKSSESSSSSSIPSATPLNSSLFLKSGLPDYGQLTKLNMDSSENLSKS